MFIHDQTRADIHRKINKIIENWGTLDVNKILECSKGAEFIKDMDPDFLRDVKDFTQTENGIAIDDSHIHFMFNARRGGSDNPVKEFTLCYNKDSGKLRGVFYLEFDFPWGFDPDKPKDIYDLTMNTVNQVVTIAKYFYYLASKKGYIYTAEGQTPPDYGEFSGIPVPGTSYGTAGGNVVSGSSVSAGHSNFRPYSVAAGRSINGDPVVYSKAYVDGGD